VHALPTKRLQVDSPPRAKEDTLRLVALVGLSVIAIALWFARASVVGPRFVFLGWNLFLAWVPWVVSVSLRAQQPGWVFWPLTLTWLAFFPNAPYLITDFAHLKARPPVPMWFDVLFLAAFAWAGCLWGWDSLWRVHRALTLRIGARWASFATAVSVALCGVGVFLGRFERLNSWELVTDPLQVAITASQALVSPRAVVFSIVFSALVGAGSLLTRPVAAGR
jgi:uncharacterized membrane protein